MKHPDRRARFDAILLPHLDAAYNLARWLLGNSQDAEDAVQDAYLRALTYFDSFHGEDGRAWLLAIVRHTCFEWLRKKRRHVEMPTEHLELARDGAPSPEALQLRNADRAAVQRAIEALPPEFREALVLREMEEMSYKQIARISKVPIGTVMSRLARARRRLLESLTSTARKETA
ncbi:MAG TPA: sigma-70 family RNA polymerase sigma factor [Bryobacteraceae bacterium]